MICTPDMAHETSDTVLNVSNQGPIYKLGCQKDMHVSLGPLDHFI